MTTGTNARPISFVMNTGDAEYQPGELRAMLAERDKIITALKEALESALKNTYMMHRYDVWYINARRLLAESETK